MKQITWWHLIFFISMAEAGFSQKWAGLHIHSGPAYDQGENIVITKNDEKYVVGTYQYDQLAYSESIRIGCQLMPEAQIIPFYHHTPLGVVIKYNAEDEIQWVRSVPLRAQDIVVNKNGDYVILGKIDYTIYINDEIYNTQGNQGLLIAYTSDGKYRWHKIIRPGSPTYSSSSTALFHSLDIQEDGNVVVSGRSNIPGTLLPDNFSVPSGGFLFRFNGETGEMQNYYDIIGNSAEVFKVHVDESDHILIGGTFKSFNFAGESYFASNYGGFLAKFDSDFNEQWAVCLKSDAQGYVGGIRSIATDNNFIYFSGKYRNSVSANDTLLIGSSIGDMDSFVGCLNNTGEVQWMRRIAGSGFEIVSDICVGSNEVFVTGIFSQNILGLSWLQADGYANVFVISLNKNGTFRFGLQGGSENEPYHDSFPNREAANAVSVDSKENVYIVGNAWGNGSYGDHSYQTNGVTDFFVAKVSNFESEISHMPPINCPPIWPEINIYPNPAINNIFVRTTGEILELEIINSIGQLVGRFKPRIDDDGIHIDITNLSSGVYILNLKTNQGEVKDKFIKISQ